jgi:hypothetical protein
MARPLPQAGQGLREPLTDGSGISPPRHDPDHDAENRKEAEIIDKFSDGL